MQLLSLTTTNFKKLGSKTFTFKEGMNVISGENAQGKSTLLEAIEAAIFGASSIATKAEHIPTWGQTKWGLDLAFIIGSDRYDIRRTGGTAKLVRQVQDGSEDLVANGTTAVKAEMETLLGLSAKDYSTFIQSKQGESTGILTFGATALNRKVEEYAGVELIEKIQNLAQLKATRLSAKAESAPSPEKVAEAEQQVKEAEHYLVQAGSAKDDSEIQLDRQGEFTREKVEDTAPAMRDQVHQASLLLQRLEAAEAAVPPAQAQVDLAQERLAGREIRDPADLKAKLETMTASGAESRKALDGLRQDKQTYEAADRELQRLRTVAETAEKSITELVDLESVSNALMAQDTAENEVTKLTKEKADADAKVRSLRALAKGAKCPTCGTAKENHDPAKLEQELAEAVGVADKLAESLTKATEKLREARTVVQKFKAQDEAAEKSLEAFTKAEEALNQHQANFDNLSAVDESQLHDAEALYEQNRNAYAEANAALKQVDQHNSDLKRDQRALETAKADLAEAQEKAAKLDKAYGELPEPPTEEEIAAAAAAFVAYGEAWAEWRLKRRELEAGVQTAKTELSHRTEVHGMAVKRHEDLLAEVARCADDVALAKKFERLVRFLREGRQGYMQQVWTTVLAVSSRLVRESSKGTITRVMNEDGQFLFEEGGIQIPSTSASGAQKSFIGSSLRVGLSRTLYGGDSLLIFDEPTESCSEFYAGSLTATLGASAKQVLLITHREADQTLADHIINVGA